MRKYLVKSIKRNKTPKIDIYEEFVILIQTESLVTSKRPPLSFRASDDEGKM